MPGREGTRVQEGTGLALVTASRGYPRESGDPAQPYVSVAETHSGAVFFAGDRAFKLKKPVSFGFLDFSTLEARRRACEQELELNRRLAPDVYLDTAALVGSDGTASEHFVVMRRLPADRRLSALVEAGAPVDDHLRALAHLLAAFHSRAARSAAIDGWAGRDAVLRRWEANAVEMAGLPGGVFQPGAAERVLFLARRYLAGRERLFSARLDAGRACDGHGDLLAEDIFCLDDGPRVLDCIDFDDRLRYGDVLYDVAFLAMDLERLGRPDLSRRFLGLYREFSGDSWPASLAHHYVAYRAQVRALVAGIRLVQADGASPEAARHLLALSAAHLELGRVRLVVVGGLPGTGKSTLAAQLAEALGAATIRSDEVRKQMMGIDPSTPRRAPLDHGLYEPEVTATTYAELVRRAGVCLSNGVSAVVDATFSDRRWREEMRTLAAEAVADLDELHCVAPLDLVESRIAARLASGGDASDATPAVARQFAAAEAPWPTAAPIDTSGPIESVRDAALERLGVPRAVTFESPPSGWASPPGPGSGSTG